MSGPSASADGGWVRPRGVKWAQVPSGGVSASVADMELDPPGVALTAARAALGRPLGYPSPDELAEVVGAVDAWWRRRHGLRLPVERTVVTTSAVNAIAGVLARATAAGDVVVRTTPGYAPLGWAVEGAGCRERTVPLTRGDDGRWSVDTGAVAAALDGAAVLLWVQPDNPTGTVWPDDVQGAVARAAAEAGVLVISDEVWADHVHAPGVHAPFAPVAREAAPDLRVVTVVGAAKTFNLAALATTLVTWSHADLRRVVAGTGRVGLLALPAEPARCAAVAAFRGGADWLERTRATTRRNRDVALERLAPLLGDDLPSPPDATYLLWFAAPDAWGTDPAAHLRDTVGLVVGDGAGMGAPGFVRITLASPPSLADDVLDRLLAA